MWEQLYVQLDKLDQLAQEIIQKEIPQEESVVLTLTDIMLDKSGCYDAFALGLSLIHISKMDKGRDLYKNSDVGDINEDI